MPYNQRGKSHDEAEREYKIIFLSMILLLACSLGFPLVSGAQLSQSDTMARASNFSSGLENRLNALQRELSELGNSTAALARRDSIPLEMENEIQNYQGRMQILFTDTKDENARRQLQIVLEDMVSRSRGFVSLVKTKSRELSRNVCIDNAYKNYKENWANTCSANRMFGDCSLSPELARNLEENHRHSRDECFNRYPP